MNYRLVFNLSISIVAAFVLAVLIFISIFSNVEKRKTAYFFLWSLVAALIPVAFMIGWYASRLSPDCPIVLAKILGTLTFVSMYATAYAFMLYCLSFFGGSKRANNILMIAMAIIGLGFSITMVVNAFNDMFFSYVVDNGVNIQPTNIIFIPYIYVWFVFLVELLLLFFKKRGG